MSVFYFLEKVRLCRNERNKIEAAPQNKKLSRKGRSPVTRSKSARSPSVRGRLVRTLSGTWSGKKQISVLMQDQFLYYAGFME